MNNHALSTTLFLALSISGCAKNSGIVPMGKDSYIVSRQAATGFHGMGGLKAEAFAEASAYCTKQNKKVQVINTTEAQPPYILGNFPKVEVQFMCLAEGDPELSRPKLRKDSGVTTLEIKTGSGANDADLYTELKKIKELLDEKVITKEEFEALKKKLFAK